MPGRSPFAAPDDCDGDERRAGGERKARRAALPRPLGAAEHRALGEEHDDIARVDGPCGRLNRGHVSPLAGDGNRAEALDRAPNQRVPPELRLREEAERPVDCGADHERVGHRVVVHDDDRRAAWDVPAPSTRSRHAKRKSGGTVARTIR